MDDRQERIRQIAEEEAQKVAMRSFYQKVRQFWALVGAFYRRQH